MSGANDNVSKSENDAGGSGGAERKNKCDEIYACKQSVRNKNMEQKCDMCCQLVIALKITLKIVRFG